jgi:predicted nucleic acid-binding protein
MPRFMLDTNCIIALLSPWHEHHEPVFREFERLTINERHFAQFAGKDLTIVVPL